MQPRHSQRQLIIIAALFIGCGNSVMAWAQAAFRYPEGQHGHGELRYHDGVPVLTVRGTPSEIGEQIGTLALKPAAKAIALVDAFADRQIPPQLRSFANVAMQAMYSQFPAEYRQELESMAEAAGVSMQSLILANTIIDLQELVGCSSLMVAASQSATGGPIYGRNMDLPYVEGLAEFSLLIIYIPDKGNAFAMPNLPGFLMLASGMNDQGLALGSQSVGPPRDGTPRFSPTGISSAVAGRRLIEGCDQVADVQHWLAANRLARGVSIAACDPESQAVFEVTTTRVLTRSDAGICSATNHYRIAELAADTDCPRYAKLEALKKSAPLDLNVVKEALHAVHQGDLTVHSMVFEPQIRRLHLAMGPGPVTNNPFAVIDLADYFNRNSSTARSATGAAAP